MVVHVAYMYVPTKEILVASILDLLIGYTGTSSMSPLNYNTKVRFL